MLTDLLDEWPALPPLATLLAIPTPDTPHILYRAWAATGATYLEDRGGRRWWAFTATVPRECPWCGAVITQGYEAWGVGSVCGWHCRVEWRNDGRANPSTPGCGRVADLGAGRTGGDGLGLAEPQPERLSDGGSTVYCGDGSGATGAVQAVELVVERAPTPVCPNCGGRVIIATDGHWYCPRCRYTIDPVAEAHNAIVPHKEA